MRRLLTWAVVSLGIAALLRRLRRRSERVEEAPRPEAVEADPADELRRKLAESRAEEEVPETPAPASATVEERRASVHAAGRSTLDDMRETDGA